MTNKLTITIYKKRGEWRWRLQAANRVIVGASSEAYKRRSRCLDNLYDVTGIAIYPREHNNFGDKARFTIRVDGRMTTGVVTKI